MSNADKTKVIEEVESAVYRLDRVIARINDGDIGFAEAGDWLHNCGDDIVSALESALAHIKEGE